MNSFMNHRVIRAAASRARFAGAMMAVAFTALFVASCDVHRLNNPGTAQSITISPNPQTLAVNGKQQFASVISDFSGAVITFELSDAMVEEGAIALHVGRYCVFAAGEQAGNEFSILQGGFSGPYSDRADRGVDSGAGNRARVAFSPSYSSSQALLQRPLGILATSSMRTRAVPGRPAWAVARGG